MSDSTAGSSHQVVVSYARSDSAAILPYVQLLEAAGIHCWIDHEDIDGAQLWAAEIADAIDQSPVLLFFVSPNAVVSKSVQRELALAFEGDKQILPLLLAPVAFPSAMRYQLAGVQHVELKAGDATPEERLPAILRALERLGVTPAAVEAGAAGPAGAGSEVIAAPALDRALWNDPAPPASVPPPKRSGSGGRQRLALLGGIGALVVIAIIGLVIAAGGGDDGDGGESPGPTVTVDAADEDDDGEIDEGDGGDGGESEAEFAPGEELFVGLDSALETPLNVRDAPAGHEVGYLPHGMAGIFATGNADGEWVEIGRDGDTGWVHSDYVYSTSELSGADERDVVSSFGFVPSADSPFDGGSGLVVWLGEQDTDLGHIEQLFFFYEGEYVGTDGFPSRNITNVIAVSDDVGASVTYEIFDGVGSSSTVVRYETPYLRWEDGLIVDTGAEGEPPLAPIDPELAEHYDVPEEGSELGHR